MDKNQLQLRSESRSGSGSIITTSDTIIERRIENVTEGLSSQCLKLLHRLLSANKENVLTICDYVFCLKSEVNLSDHYRKDVINLLCTFTTFFKNKLFKNITREDLLSFLDSFRKVEAVDPLHKWIMSALTDLHN